MEVNGLNTPIKRQKLTGQTKKKKQAVLNIHDPINRTSKYMKQIEL